MKIRIKIPETIRKNQDRTQEYIDDILLWGMETEMDIEFYALQSDKNFDWKNPVKWATFSVQPESYFMFILKWGASQKRIKPRDPDFSKEK